MDENASFQQKLAAKYDAHMKVGEVRVVGCERTKPEFLEGSRALFGALKSSGSLAQLRREIDNTLKRLESTDSLSSVDIRVFPSPNAGSSADVLVRVKEAPHTTLQSDTYFNGNAVGVQGMFTKRNVFGRLENLTVHATLDQTTSSALNVSFVKPFVLGLPLDVGVRAYHNTDVKQHSQSHDLIRSGVATTFSFPPPFPLSLLGPTQTTGDGENEISNSNALTNAVAVGVETRNLTKCDSASNSMQEFAGAQTKMFATYTLSRTAANKSGSFSTSWTANTEVGAVGERDQFAKGTFQTALSWKPFAARDVTFGVEGMCGYIHPIQSGGQNFHPADRFLLGGPGSLRGFALHSVGPTDARQPESPNTTGEGSSSRGVGVDAVGGDVVGSVNCHVSAPVTHPLLAFLSPRMHGFVNVGNLVQKDAEKTALAEALHFRDTARATCGFGFWIPLGGVGPNNVNAGRLELNWCHPLLFSATSDAQNLSSFQIGFSKSF